MLWSQHGRYDQWSDGPPRDRRIEIFSIGRVAGSWYAMLADDVSPIIELLTFPYGRRREIEFHGNLAEHQVAVISATCLYGPTDISLSCRVARTYYPSRTHQNGELLLTARLFGVTTSDRGKTVPGLSGVGGPAASGTVYLSSGTIFVSSPAA